MLQKVSLHKKARLKNGETNCYKKFLYTKKQNSRTERPIATKNLSTQKSKTQKRKDQLLQKSFYTKKQNSKTARYNFFIQKNRTKTKKSKKCFKKKASWVMPSNVRRYATFFLRRISGLAPQAQEKCGEARAPQRPQGVRSGAYSGCCAQ